MRTFLKLLAFLAGFAAASLAITYLLQANDRPEYISIYGGPTEQ